MIRRGLIIVLAAALAGCASADSYEAPVARAGAPSADVADSRDCRSGNQACIDRVVAEMQRRYAPLARACDRRAPFALMYMRVTEGVKAPNDRFQDQDYLRRLDALFARHYFRAFDAYDAGGSTPPAWRIAFDSARRGLTTGIGDMLLGMNAHISNDLPFAIVEAGLDRRSAREDFDAVNDLLGDVQRPMIEEEARLFDPAIADATLPYLGVRAGEIATVIAAWRTEAWQNARRLADAPDGAAAQRVARRIRAAAAERARVIQALSSNRLLGSDPEVRDAHCRMRGAGA